MHFDRVARAPAQPWAPGGLAHFGGAAPAPRVDVDVLPPTLKAPAGCARQAAGVSGKVRHAEWKSECSLVPRLLLDDGSSQAGEQRGQIASATRRHSPVDPRSRPEQRLLGGELERIASDLDSRRPSFKGDARAGRNGDGQIPRLIRARVGPLRHAAPEHGGDRLCTRGHTVALNPDHRGTEDDVKARGPDQRSTQDGVEDGFQEDTQPIWACVTEVHARASADGLSKVARCPGRHGGSMTRGTRTVPFPARGPPLSRPRGRPLHATAARGRTR